MGPLQEILGGPIKGIPLHDDRQLALKGGIMDKNQLPPLQQASIFDVRAMSEAERASLGYLVLVMRRWPQGFSWEALDLQLWLPDAGPSPELLKAYQAKQIDWEEFAQRYRVEQIANWRRAGYYKVGKGDERSRNRCADQAFRPARRVSRPFRRISMPN